MSDHEFYDFGDAHERSAHYEIVGDNVVGFDWQGLVSNLATTGEGVYKSVEADKAAKKSKADEAAALKRSIEADIAWANAEANLEVLPNVGSQAVRDTIKRAADVAAQALSSDGVTKRCEASQKSFQEAARVANASPGDAGKQARMHGWQKVAAACDVSGKSGKGDTGESWLTRRTSGLPGYGWLIVGGVGAAALAFIIRALAKRS